ncbi:MAG: carbon-nitrogen hydrolase family protein [Pygmaiobacter massiliensis]|nr:carbon-nitrogen hydrolase family protein [Pygmaiobacter massiliensis]
MSKYLQFIEKAAQQKADLIVFPELSLQGFPPSMLEVDPAHALYQHREAELVPEGPTTQLLIQKAKEHNMYIAWGMTERDHDKFDALYNSLVLVGPEGYLDTYRKIHNPMTERLYYFPGTEFKVVDTRIGKIGLMICFDKAFPESARSLAVMGAQIILCPTAWPLMEGSKEDKQLQLYNIFDYARAAENMVFFVSSNHVGNYDKEMCCGHSHILGPYPYDNRADTLFREDMAIAEIDVEQEPSEARHTSMGLSNLLKDRRPDTYGELTKLSKYSFMGGEGVTGTR